VTNRLRLRPLRRGRVTPDYVSDSSNIGSEASPPDEGADGHHAFLGTADLDALGETVLTIRALDEAAGTDTHLAWPV
jgi:hypothetical protein